MVFKFVSMDIETSGLDYLKCQILEIGAVIADITGKIYSEFHYYVDHKDNLFWDTDNNGKQVAREMNEQRYLHELMHAKMERFQPWDKKDPACYKGWVEAPWVSYAIAHWLKANGYQRNFNDKITFAGKNFGQFDWMFFKHSINPNLPDYLYTNKIYSTRRFMDPAMLYFDPTIDEQIPSLDTCLQRAGINKAVTHCALDDCKDVVNCIAAHYSHLTQDPGESNLPPVADNVIVPVGKNPCAEIKLPKRRRRTMPVAGEIQMPGGRYA